MLTTFVIAISLDLLGQQCLAYNSGCKHEHYCKISALHLGDMEGVSYGLSHYCHRKGHKLVLEARPSRSQRGADWHEIDKLYIAIDDEKFIIDSSGLCRKDGKVDPELFAIVRPEHGQYWRAVKAWRADRKRKKFVPVSAPGVDCENEGHGT